LSVRPLVVDLGRDYRGGQHQALLLLQGLLSRGHAPELVVIADSELARRAKDAGISKFAVWLASIAWTSCTRMNLTR
jgi:hypothetical protein